MDGQLTEAEKSFRSEKMIELHHRHAGDYGVNDIVIVKAEGFLEEHIMTGEAVE